MASVLLASCSGNLDYSPPARQAEPDNTVVLQMSFDEVWDSAIPALGASFFVINTLERDSGLINIELSGDPEQYVDCGRIRSEVSNARGERVYDFPAASADETYEIMDLETGTGLSTIERSMDLDGVANVIFEDVSRNQTRVTVNVRYVVTKTIRQTFAANLQPYFETDSIAFNTGGGDTFSAGTTCRATGELEAQIIQALQIG